MLDLEKVVSLPTIPTVFAKVSAIAADSKSTIQDLTRAVEQDQAVAARTLRIANSAAFGLYSRVRSLQHACALLGMRMVRNVVLQTSLMSHYDKLRAVKGFDLDRFWRHAFLTAVASRTLARYAVSGPKLLPDDCYTAGLLHDLGKLVLLENRHEDYIRALALATEKILPIWEAEAAVFGFDHAHIGSYLAGRWGFPEEICSAIRGHHFPPVGDAFEGIAVLVATANLVAQEADKPEAERAEVSVDPRLHSLLGIPLEAVPEVMKDLQAADRENEAAK